jgi:hypothetical protein
VKDAPQVSHVQSGGLSAVNQVTNQAPNSGFFDLPGTRLSEQPPGPPRNMITLTLRLKLEPLTQPPTLFAAPQIALPGIAAPGRDPFPFLPSAGASLVCEQSAVCYVKHPCPPRPPFLSWIRLSYLENRQHTETPEVARASHRQNGRMERELLWRA